MLTNKTTVAEIEKLLKKLIPNMKSFHINDRRINSYFPGHLQLTGQVYTEKSEVFDFSLPLCDKS